jgi:hypothetical protein
MGKAMKYKPERIVNLPRKTEAVAADEKTYPASTLDIPGFW